MPTSRNTKKRSLIQCWVKKERREYLTHEKMLIHIEKGINVSVGWGSRDFKYKKRALEILQGLTLVSSIER